MDDDLRSLERRAATDPTLLPRLLAARARAGLDTGAAERALAAATAALDAARAACAAALRQALRSFVAAAFEERPDVLEVELRWALQEHPDRPWTVRTEVRSGPHALHAGLADGFARLGSLLASRHQVHGRRLLRRDGERVVLVDEERRGRQRAGEPLATAEVGLRRVEDLGQHLGPSPDLGPAPVTVLHAGARSTTAALLLADGADADLAEAEAAFVAAGGAAWDAFVPALFVELPELEAVVIDGFTSGYNDNWYDEHDERVYFHCDDLEWLIDEQRPDLLDACAGLGVPREGRRLPDAVIAGVRERLERFQHLLRLRYGHAWTLVLARDGAAGVVRRAPTFPR